MKKIKYYYNTHSLRYEKLETPFRVKLLRVFAFIATAIVTSAIISYFAFQFIGSPGEKILRAQNERLRTRFENMSDEVNSLEQQMAELEKRDNTVYRSIFEAKPIPDSVRAKELEKQKEIAKVEKMEDYEVVQSIQNTLKMLSGRINIQKRSYKELEGLMNNKEKILAATPAIQPVSNKDLSRIASGFGYRIDPVYKSIKMHAGLDFAAPQGTPIYATANGRIKTSGYSSGGYGNHVVIDQVLRGEIIGYVGTTGKSTGPHCHYEVHKNGNKIDPVYFFYNDLSPQQFDELLKRAQASNQSFD
jgi:murein DD-endopeptidase MepM/ murein hydrolase activator NlpD